MRALLTNGTLSAGHGRALLGLGDELRIADLARKAAAEGWSVRELEAEVQRQRPVGNEKAPVEKPRDAGERRLEEELQRVLGTAARIHRQRGGKGVIEIPFFNAEDFERVFELLAGRPASDIV